MRGVVEVVASIAYLVRENFYALRCSGPIARVIATGGLARSDGLMQLIADLCGIPLLRPAQAEATARGMFGLLTRTRASVPPTVAMQTFEPECTVLADAGFMRWRDAMRRAVSG